METRETIAQVLAALLAAYPHAKVREETVEIYCRALADIPPEVLDAAAMACLATCKFFPTIAELRDQAAAVASRAHPSAIEAWGIVMEQVRQHSIYTPHHFDDPLIARLVESIGWYTLCTTTDVAITRAHFTNAYKVLLDRERQDAVMLPAVRELARRLQATPTTPKLPPPGDDHAHRRP